MIDIFHVIGTMFWNRKRSLENEQSDDETYTIQNANTETLKEVETHLDSTLAKVRNELNDREEK